MKKKTVRDLDDAQIRGKRALVRVDFNVPLDENGNITDDTRIRASLPTLELLLERGARPVILSHLGRPKGKPEPKYSLEPVAKRLGELTGKKVNFVESTDSDEALQASQNLKPGEILLLDNTRFLGG
jgi:3-phosphoglycerate kinase